MTHNQEKEFRYLILNISTELEEFIDTLTDETYERGFDEGKESRNKEIDTVETESYKLGYEDGYKEGRNV